ncbi:DNA topoisomerase 2 [Pichia californica]|uniref:DNA topoisomerase 2 n=1 Tax=Pichia californica TaxID=460514 RepID=A0A9P6WMR9_9ASCO|nr:DNA topoisomerase 2 [[Candida] californica]
MSSESGSDYFSSDEETLVSKKPKTSKSNSKEKPASKVKTTKAKSGKSNASDQYQKLSQLEHILKRPDTYIGSVEHHAAEQWIYNDETKSMEKKIVSIVPGLFKIFDEILVNAADNKIRDPTMKKIDVIINAEENIISVKNDGKGIPIEIHDKEKIYIPELIFGNLLTSSNYDDDEKKVTGGRNGYGAKLCNIFSTEFTVHTADKTNGKEYTQTWRNNMSEIGTPKIVSFKKQTEFTEIKFKPDLSKFGMTKLDENILGVFKRRVFDVCGSVRGIKVTLNGEPLKINNFKQYVELYVKAIEKAKEENPHVPVHIKTEGEEDGSETPEPTNAESENDNITPEAPIEKLPTIVHEIINDRWEVAFCISDGSFNQVSFVNSIATTVGGTHVDYVANMLVGKITEQIRKKNKKAIIKPFQIKSKMFLFINCLIENPAFTSQTKEYLTTQPSKFGGKKLELPDKFIKRVLACGILDEVLDIAQANADKALKKNDGSRKSRITGYPKLEDANKAGTKEGYKCTLILTEGDSAKSLAVAGLAVVGRNYYGCFPLRGKLLNVREASTDQIMKSGAIQAIKQIIGLQHKKHYKPDDIKSLRYGRIMIMADQDHDGSHIKGLIINFLETSFPGLLEIPNFLIEFITPIVKITIMSGPNKKKTIPFYSMPEYENWRENEGATCSYKQKYYKGLGTSSASEMREYFGQLDRHLKKFDALKDEDKFSIDLAFSKKKADDRKEWLRTFQPGTYLDPTLTDIPITEFINKELILFSMADNVRSIPSIMDGFKPVQRKILYACYKRNLKDEIKVSQLEGYISEHTGYHHGDASLMQSIIGLAQDFVGSNNLNILIPHGGFGSRAAGGKDAAAARYIFTELSHITKKVFNPLDNPLLNYLQDDEQTVEPEWYTPVLPMLLVNGCEGIGSGWSTSIPPFNPIDIIENIRLLMKGEDMKEMSPWFKGWEGTIIREDGKDRWRLEGIIEEIDDNTIEITELPARMWTITMKEFLLNGLAGSDKQKPWIKDMEEDHGVGVKFIVKLSDEEMEKSRRIGHLERFKLVSTISSSNMVAFDSTGKIKKYPHVNEIIRDYYFIRLEFYQKRKNYMVKEYSNQLEKISSQAKFVKMIIDRSLIVGNKQKKILIEELRELDFPGFDKQNEPVQMKHSSVKVENDDSSDEEVEAEEGGIAADTTVSEETGLVVTHSFNSSQLYDYLLGMPIWSLTKERYESLLKIKGEKEVLLNTLLQKSPKDLWNEDIEEFLIAWDKFLIEDEENRKSLVTGNGEQNGTKKRRRAPPKKKTDVKPKTETKKTAIKKEKKDISEPKTKKARSPTPTTNNSKIKKEKQEEALKKEVDDLNDFDSIFKQFSKSSSAFKESAPSSSTESTSSKSTGRRSAPKVIKKKKAKVILSDDDDDEDVHVNLSSDNFSDDDIVVEAPARKSSRPTRSARSSRSKTPTKSYTLDSDDDEDVSMVEEVSDDDYSDA